MMKLLAAFATFTAALAFPVIGAPPVDDSVKKTIDYLIQTTAESKLTFIRNGSEHTAPEAAALMRRKLAAVTSQVKTPEDFIRLAASQSHLSGKPYLVKLGDGKTMPTGEWLTGILRVHRVAPPNPTPHL